MIKRRQFLGGLTALGGAYMLNAYGQVSGAVLGGASPDGTAIPSGSVIIDKMGSRWTVSNGVIYRDGGTVGNTYNVSLLLWYGGKMWHIGTGGQFYVLTDLDKWLPCNDPRVEIGRASCRERV